MFSDKNKKYDYFSSSVRVLNSMETVVVIRFNPNYETTMANFYCVLFIELYFIYKTKVLYFSFFSEIL